MKTQLEVSQIALQHIKPLINRFNKRYEYRPYQYDKYIHIIDINSVKGSANNVDDLLNTNFWALLIGTLRNIDQTDCINTDGLSGSLRASNYVQAGSAYLVYGSGTTPERFTDYRLASYSGSVSATFLVTTLADRSRVSISGVIPVASNEIGIYQALKNVLGGTYTAMLARVTGSFGAYQGVAYNIDFLNPWVSNIARLMCGIHSNSNVSLTKIDGTTITARVLGDVNAGSIFLVVSSSGVSWSPALYSIPNPITMEMSYGDISNLRTVRYTAAIGSLTPSSDLSIQSIALYQEILDTASARQTVCMAVIPLASPITFYANRLNVVVVRILAF